MWLTSQHWHFYPVKPLNADSRQTGEGVCSAQFSTFEWLITPIACSIGNCSFTQLNLKWDVIVRVRAKILSGPWFSLFIWIDLGNSAWFLPSYFMVFLSSPSLSHPGWVCLPLPNPLTSSSCLSWLLPPISSAASVARQTLTNPITSLIHLSCGGLWVCLLAWVVVQTRCPTQGQNHHTIKHQYDHSDWPLDWIYQLVSLTKMHKSLPDPPRHPLQFSSPPLIWLCLTWSILFLIPLPVFPIHLAPWARGWSFMFCPDLPLWSACAGMKRKEASKHSNTDQVSLHLCRSQLMLCLLFSFH